MLSYVNLALPPKAPPSLNWTDVSGGAGSPPPGIVTVATPEPASTAVTPAPTKSNVACGVLANGVPSS